MKHLQTNTLKSLIFVISLICYNLISFSISSQEIKNSGTPITIRAFTGYTGDTGELPTQVFAHVSGTSKTDTGVMLEVEDYGTIDPSQVVRFKN